MVKLVVYLAGADYKVRHEQEVDEKDYDDKKKRKTIESKLKQTLIRDYGSGWKQKTKSQVKIRVIKEIKTYTRRVIVRGKDLGVKTIKSYKRASMGWTDYQEKQVMSLFKEKRPLKEIARKTGRSYDSVKNKLQRLRGIKK